MRKEVVQRAKKLLDLCGEVEKRLDCDICGHSYRSATGTTEEECCSVCQLRKKFREAKEEFESSFLEEFSV